MRLLSLLFVLQAQLSALVSKCKPGADDLEYFLLEAGQLVGLDVPPEQGAKVGRGAVRHPSSLQLFVVLVM
jgi:hypothetical protein